MNNLGFSTALEFQGIPNYAISWTQRVELLAIFLELEAKTASCGQGMDTVQVRTQYCQRRPVSVHILLRLNSRSGL